MVRSRRGDSLVELIVALLILELVGAAALATALTVERLVRHATHGSRDDTARLLQYRSLENDSTCVHATTPDTMALTFPATADRPALDLVWRCGR